SDYVWSWETQVHSHRIEEPRTHFRQSTFWGASLAPGQLVRRSSGYQPKLKKDGEIDLQIVQLMDGSHSNGEIAKVLQERFPDRFRSYREALTRIGDLAERYSQ